MAYSLMCVPSRLMHSDAYIVLLKVYIFTRYMIIDVLTTAYMTNSYDKNIYTYITNE